MSNITIRKAGIQDKEIVGNLAKKLWPKYELKDLIEEMSYFLAGENSVIFLAFEGDEAIGFSQCQLRFDYTGITESVPCGYLEGIFVVEDKRKSGVGKELVRCCEEWTKNMGYREFASDCELWNDDSLSFHKSLGFQEFNRIICFNKKLY